ncbi:cupin domain-containing protein [Pseudoalteromonas sp. CNC9-20]|uniref:(R)-mandelonitrile lyase n=1 Tax=Pseudoalteromonas sp. CNC9-20 TaxID=2917750 RepID=UPI001EF57670|nr:cupin domain-containing protein [Pseudoalteromonas sp. CNC9-20]MCG7571455.1 cupin domain-containing protein [Pseudoalteromonas sp. CNC9-20]
MKAIIPTLMLIIGLTMATQAMAQSAPEAQISVQVNGSQLPLQGLEQYFSGAVRVEPLFQPQPQTRAGGANVTFEPGSRTHWHTHPRGQTLIVTSGQGWVQQWQGRRLVIEPGDVVHIPANVKHWHGATARTAMTHMAIQESHQGSVVTWMEAVTDKQYQP